MCLVRSPIAFVAALAGSLDGSAPVANPCVRIFAARIMCVRSATSNPRFAVGCVTPPVGPGVGAPGAVFCPTTGRGVEGEAPGTWGNAIRGKVSAYLRCLRLPRRSKVMILAPIAKVPRQRNHVIGWSAARAGSGSTDNLWDIFVASPN